MLATEISAVTRVRMAIFPPILVTTQNEYCIINVLEMLIPVQGEKAGLQSFVLVELQGRIEDVSGDELSDEIGRLVAVQVRALPCRLFFPGDSWNLRWPAAGAHLSLHV